jgi:8-oxo-dGTP pyrophosphatase MutT (NUDIX family)
MNQSCKSSTTLLYCAGLLYIKNKKLLLAYSNNKQCFYLPGGKINSNETAATALCREVLEEMNVVINENALQFYTHISAPAYGEAAGIVMEQDCFILQQPIQPVAAAEIVRLQYFSLKEYLKEPNIASGAVMVLEQLQKDGYID